MRKPLMAFEKLIITNKGVIMVLEEDIGGISGR